MSEWVPTEIRRDYPRCNICGKFQKFDDLILEGTPEYEDGTGCHAEDFWFECKKCNKSGETK